MTVRTRPQFRSKLHWRTQFAIQNMPPPHPPKTVGTEILESAYMYY